MTLLTILPGLPATGDPAVPFPADWGRLGREGFVVRIQPSGSPAWTANLGPGLSGHSGAYEHPNGRDVVLISRGQGFVIDPFGRTLVHTLGAVISQVWQLQNPARLLLDHQGIYFESLGAEGRLWQTRRISWDGFDHLVVNDDQISGAAWDATRDLWASFKVDMSNGRVWGGAYDWSDAADSEQLGPAGAA